MFCLENLVKAVCCASPMAGVGMGCKRALLDIGWHTGRHRTFPPAHKNCTSDTKASRPPPVVEALAPRVVLEEKRRRRPVSARGCPSHPESGSPSTRRSAGPGQLCWEGCAHTGGAKKECEAVLSTSWCAPTRPGATSGAGKESEVRSGWLEESCVWAGWSWRERAEHP